MPGSRSIKDIVVQGIGGVLILWTSVISPALGGLGNIDTVCGLFGWDATKCGSGTMVRSVLAADWWGAVLTIVGLTLIIWRERKRADRLYSRADAAPPAAIIQDTAPTIQQTLAGLAGQREALETMISDARQALARAEDGLAKWKEHSARYRAGKPFGFDSYHQGELYNFLDPSSVFVLSDNDFPKMPKSRGRKPVLTKLEPDPAPERAGRMMSFDPNINGEFLSAHHADLQDFDNWIIALRKHIEKREKELQEVRTEIRRSVIKNAQSDQRQP